ncbi:MAG: ABC transporter ATP-binding protein [Erysipelotrichaceae bacterium]|nr:ABC transporter ATP-binding protein [Erysipelotrichaceae bacterium]
MLRLLRKYTQDGWWAALLGPLFVILEVLFEVFIPYVMSKIIDVGINERGGDLDYIMKMGGLMVLLAVGACLTGIVAGFLSSVSSSRFIRNLRNSMFEKIQTYDFRNIERFNVSTVVMRLTTDMRMMRMAYVAIVRMLIRSPINLIISSYMVWRMNSRLAMIFAVAIPVLFTGLYTITTKAHPRFVTMMNRYDEMNNTLKENIEGIRVVKTFVRESHEQEQFENKSLAVTAAQRYAEGLVILSDPFFQLVMYACMIAIAWFGGNHIIQGIMTTGQFMSYLSYVRAILFSLMMVSNALLQIVMAQASVTRANEILDEKTDIDDSDADPELQVESGEIEFRNVSFKYDADSESEALSDIDLKISSGEVIGIIGSTGSSKTTLVQLIPRLYEATRGEVYVGGRNVKEYRLKNLREAVSMVLQKNTLFSGTIEENLKWGNPDATHEEVVEACRNAQAHDFIMAKPNGYDTDLGQGGVNVSGGQKQRLCIARALLKKPKIIILDDSTSAVDTDTDHRIQMALKEKLGDMTTIIIAQRIASIKEADRIVIMNEGRIDDVGTHEELLERNEVYRDLYQTQLQGVQE